MTGRTNLSLRIASRSRRGGPARGLALAGLGLGLRFGLGLVLAGASGAGLAQETVVEGAEAPLSTLQRLVEGGLDALRPDAAEEAAPAPGVTVAQAGGEGPLGVLLTPDAPPDAIRGALWMLPQDASQVAALAASAPPKAPEEALLVVTGAYSSGDAFRPEGFFMLRGAPVRPFPQGWDGMLLIDAEGRLSLHATDAVAFEERTHNLRDDAERSAFVAAAEAAGLSALQSHLLIRDGALDLRPIAGAPRFQRRLLFQTADGRVGVYDTRPNAVTLYEAAAALLAEHGPVMALNLDMGAYDFCWRYVAAEPGESCGRLTPGTAEQLTNLLALRWRAD